MQQSAIIKGRFFSQTVGAPENFNFWGAKNCLTLHSAAVCSGRVLPLQCENNLNKLGNIAFVQCKKQLTRKTKARCSSYANNLWTRYTPANRQRKHTGESLYQSETECSRERGWRYSALPAIPVPRTSVRATRTAGVFLR